MSSFLDDTLLWRSAFALHFICMTNGLYLVDAACCYRPSSMVCLSVIVVNPAKTAEPIKMPFWLSTRLGPRNHILDGSPDPPMRSSNF